MSKQTDFKKEWENTKKKLLQFSKDATEIAKKGEKEVLQFTHRSKLQIDSTAIGLKKEHLYYLIGKEYSKIDKPADQTPQLLKLIGELKKINKEQRTLKSKLNTKKSKSK